MPGSGARCCRHLVRARAKAQAFLRSPLWRPSHTKGPVLAECTSCCPPPFELSSIDHHTTTAQPIDQLNVRRADGLSCHSPIFRAPRPHRFVSLHRLPHWRSTKQSLSEREVGGNLISTQCAEQAAPGITLRLRIPIVIVIVVITVGAASSPDRTTAAASLLIATIGVLFPQLRPTKS